SPDNTFQAFVLYHRLSRETLYRLRTTYAGGLIGRLRAEQDRARHSGDARKVSDLQLQIEDVEEFRGRIEKIERGDELKYRIRCLRSARRGARGGGGRSDLAVPLDRPDAGPHADQVRAVSALRAVCWPVGGIGMRAHEFAWLRAAGASLRASVKREGRLLYAG